ncbi:MAG: PQQ-dependent sugar dehydrogenase [Rhodothermia bacterium]|nr:PQQ-dependent sugar dehydrogenase [Rhodothermia bacterium]
MRRLLFFSLLVSSIGLHAQSFNRSELPTQIIGAWEVVYGPDNFLWLSEANGQVLRVDPKTGAKQVVYAAPDYFEGSPKEQLQACHFPNILGGTLGLTLDPDFTEASKSFVYYVYSYNSGTTENPATKFKIVRLKWDTTTQSITEVRNLVLDLPTSYDHIGGRLLAVKQQGVSHLFFTIGDHGISDDNAPTCYTPQSKNPNNLAQDVAFKNGKIHRFNMDGSIPSDNPTLGNSWFTRGHRNPQGLIYNAAQNILYDVEHGDRTDDEINILELGKNYGWKQVRGYHSDGNFPTEIDFVKNYVPDPKIPQDELKEAMFAWCNTSFPTDPNNLTWCSVAPSDGIYYHSNTIPEWNNSLLIVTLKDGYDTDQEVYQFKLSADGKSLDKNAAQNPKRYFAADQALNGRLRDIAVSPDGKEIFLINNGGADRNKIIMYTYNTTLPIEESPTISYHVFPNPTRGIIQIDSTQPLHKITIFDVLGQQYLTVYHTLSVDISTLPIGVYFLKMETIFGKTILRKVVKDH